MKNTTQRVNSFSIFDWLKEVTYIKSNWDVFSNEQIKSFEPYLINRFLSMSKSYVELINYVQTIPYTEKEKYYKVYCSLIPKQQFWSKYIKQTGKQHNVDLIKYMTVYFECNSKDAIDYIDILDKDAIIKCLSDVGIESKEIKKLIKNG